MSRNYSACFRWVGLVDEVCSLTGEDRWRFTAMGFQESGWGDALTPPGDPCGTGDHGHGHGFFQIDDRTHGSFIDSADFRDPKKQALYACKILRENRDWFRRSSLNTSDPVVLERMVWAAYNCGPGNVRKHVVGDDPSVPLEDRIDAGTANGHYSKGIFQIAAELKARFPTLFDASPEHRFPSGPPEEK